MWEKAVVPLVSAGLGAAALFGVGLVQSSDDDVNCSTARSEALARHNDSPPEVDEAPFPADSPEQEDCQINEYIVDLNESD